MNMNGKGMPHMNNTRILLIGVLLSIVSAELARNSSAVAQEMLILETVFPEWREDANLNDVAFAEPNRATAVGNQGLLLQTKDNGRNWQTYRTNINCKLASVSFANNRRGIIVGGYDIPAYQKSKGMILITSNGGDTWQAVPDQNLPRLRWCKFVSETEAWAVGDSSPSYPSGLFQSNDGGRTWRAATFSNTTEVPDILKDPEWRSADANEKVIHLISPTGEACRYQAGKFQQSVFTSEEDFRLRGAVATDDRFGWAIGIAGQVAETRNAGLSWNQVAIDQMDFAPTDIDLTTIEQHGDKLWVAGNPGTYIYQFDTVNQSWSRSRTGSTTGIRGIEILDGQTALAIGESATVLQTTDGGTTWKRVNGQSRPTALWHIAETPQDVCIELVSRYSIENHWQCGVLILQPGADSDRVEQALSRAGVSVVSFADQQTDQIKLISRYLRQWRPQIVAWSGSSNQMALQIPQAVSDAGDSRKYPDQITEQGLDTHDVPYTIRVSMEGKGESRLSTAQFLTQIGRRLDDHSTISRLLLGQSSNAEAIGLSLSQSATAKRASAADLESMLIKASLPIAKRNWRSPPDGSLAMMRAAARKSKQLTTLQNFDFQSSGQRNWVTGLNRLVQGLDPLTAGVWLQEVTNQAKAAGNNELAANTLIYFALNYADHPLLYQELIWGWQYFGSDEYTLLEINKQIAQQGDISLNQATGQTRQQIQQQGASTIITWQPLGAEEQSDGVERTSMETTVKKTVLAKSTAKNRFEQSQRLASLLTQLDYDAFQEPRMKLASIRLEQKNGVAINPSAQFKQLFFANESFARFAAQVEMGRLTGEKTRGVPKLHSQPVAERPHLDGFLDEEFWQNFSVTDAARMRAPGNQGFDTLLFAHDDEFLYLGLVCEKLADHHYLDSDQPRQRDPDQAGVDRLTIEFDVDRDYSTGFEMTFDSRGQVVDRCENSIEWNPECYIAQNSTEQHWIIEAAIRLDELVIDPANLDMWKIQCSRSSNATGITHWPPVAHDSQKTGQRAGYLIFARD